MKYLVLLALAGCIGARAFTDEPVRVFVIGDSISMQYGPYLKEGLGEGFRYDRKRGDGQGYADLDRPVGANGGDSRMVLEYLRTGAGARAVDTADVLLLNCGLHDIKTSPRSGNVQVPPALYAATLDTILREAVPAGTQLIWVRTTPVVDSLHNGPNAWFLRYAADVTRYNAIADSVMAAHGVPSVDLYGFSDSWPADAFKDHVHYREAYRARHGAFLAGWLRGWATSQ